jgi:hypothetical protein
MKSALFLLIFLMIITTTNGQTISTYIPEEVDKSKKYLFYLHGGIVQEHGINAVSPEFGPYEYLKILDSLRRYGFNVISEARPKGIRVEKYADRVSKQIDTLLILGVAPDDVIVVGASLGAYITVETAHKLKNSKINYVIMALCNEYNLNYYSKYKKELCGNFLSIYESSDQKGSCDKLLMEQHCKSGYKEIRLNMGNGHGFIYRSYKEWILPIVNWVKENE